MIKAYHVNPIWLNWIALITQKNEISFISLETHKSFHQHFGFKCKPTENINKLKINNYVEKDTVFLDSGNIGSNGEYNYGVSLEVALMTHHDTAEDAIVINRATLDKLKFNLYEKRTISFGKSTFPLNIYGDLNNYKSFPDIGEYIREDGLLFASRSYNENMAPMEMNIFSCMSLDLIFDNTVYVRAGRGKVIDIRVQHGDLESNIVPLNMVKQIDKYIIAQRNFYTEILDFEKQLRHESKRRYGKDNLRISNELHRLIMEALIYTDGYPYQTNNTVNKVYRKEPLDDFRIEFVIEYEVTPNVGFKLTGGHGDKGVICKILEPHEMPRDKAGNVADLIMDPGSTVNRTNLGRLYEQYLGAAARDIR